MTAASTAPADTGVVRRQDYTPPAFHIRETHLSFDLDTAKTRVASRLRIEPQAHAAGQPLVLDGEGLTLLRVQINGDSVSFRQEGDTLTIDSVPAEPFWLELRNTVAPDKNTELSGLYASSGGLFTQCEAQGFRRITFYLDRPDVMSVFTVTLRGDTARFPVMLSNGNLVSQSDLPEGRHEAVWHDPHPKPCYLFALVAADLVCREQQVRSRSGRDHLLQIYVRAGDLDKTEHAMQSLMASIAWDEHRFGLSLDLERFMIVAVPDFNMGAMENKGLNIFNTRYVLAKPATATDADFDGIESVVAHEYFHNWTGNRITCRDWFQLSLKEGLTVFRDQEFSMDMAGSASARAVRRLADVRQLRALQFPEDDSPMAHPVRPDSYVAIDNFYTMTVYEKGAEVVRMMQTLVGRDGFRKGMDLYFQRHDGQAVTCDDFAQAIADANPDSALAQQLDRFKVWYAQAGTPRLHARGQHDAAAQTYTLTLTQSNPTAVRVHGQEKAALIPVRLGLLDASGRALPLQRAGSDAPAVQEELVVLTEAQTTLTWTGIAQPPVPSLLRGFSAPVLLQDDLSADDRLLLLAHDADAFNRCEAAQRLLLDQGLAALEQTSPLPPLSPRLVDALRAVLRDPSLDAAFKAQVLSQPAQAQWAQALSERGRLVDPQAIHRTHSAITAQLAQQLWDDWLAAFDASQISAAYAPTAQQAGQRELAHLALLHIAVEAQRRGDAIWPGRIYQRFKDAGNMTDRMGALLALQAAGHPLFDQALARFYELFKGDALVLDKWFALQARTPEPVDGAPGVALARVRQLLQHPDFSLANPNRARSLIFSYCMNPAGLHLPGGEGYAFWADQVLALSPRNPQVASRLARMLERWRVLAPPWQDAARAALERVAQADLPSDVREVIARALAPQSSAD
ncbi:aminopeptidase N [Amphibiibacter pelophylacis]|uniref:Aminopeptidase N n=1 Tax=Amphibiibacter pelophylacis TaxID=1799477 RepID=A0ACC6P148_9BURK